MQELLNKVHPRRLLASWFHLFLQNLFTVQAQFLPSCCDSHCASFFFCTKAQSSSTNNSRHNSCFFLHCCSPDFMHSQLQGHLSIFTVLHASFLFWFHPPRTLLAHSSQQCSRQNFFWITLKSGRGAVGWAGWKLLFWKYFFKFYFFNMLIAF